MDEHGMQGALEHRRNWLIQQLCQYRKRKGFNIAVVFDGWRSGSVNEVAQQRDGAEIVYSRLGEKADAVVVRIGRTKGGGCVVVSSDRRFAAAWKNSMRRRFRRVNSTGSLEHWTAPMPRMN